MGTANLKNQEEPRMKNLKYIEKSLFSEEPRRTKKNEK